MSPRTTGILAVVALALGLFVWFHEIEGEADRRAAAAEEKQVFRDFAATEIDAVSLRTLDGIDARFERREGRWWLVEPLLARADATALDAITNALANLPKEGSIAAGKDLADFDLGADPDAPGGARRLVTFEVAGETRGLRVGRATPVGGHRYVARLADEAIAYVESFRVNAFERNLADLRDRDVFTFASDDVERITIAGPDGGRPIVLGREAGANWQILEPFAAKADREAVRQLVSNLAHLRARNFVDAPEVVDQPLRDETTLRLAWRLAGEEADRTARIAGAMEGGRLFEAGRGEWVLIAEERLQDFPAEVEHYRFKRLADFDLASARRVELHFLEASADSSASLDVVAELREVGWASEESPLDPDRMSRLVRDLANLSATAVLAEEMGEAELVGLGLVPPRARLRVEGGLEPGEPVETLADLRFGRFDAARGLVVQRADMDTVFVVEPEVAEGLPYSADHYRFAFETLASGEEADDPAPEIDPLEGVPAP